MLSKPMPATPADAQGAINPAACDASCLICYISVCAWRVRKIRVNYYSELMFTRHNASLLGFFEIFVFIFNALLSASLSFHGQIMRHDAAQLARLRPRPGARIAFILIAGQLMG